VRAVVPGVKGRRVRSIVRAEADGAGHDADDTPANPLDLKELLQIIKTVSETDVVDLELKGNNFSLMMRKLEGIVPPEAPSPPPQPQFAPPPPMPQWAPPPQPWGPPPPYQMGPPPPYGAPGGGAPAPAGGGAAPVAAGSAPAAGGGTELLSPMGGTYYRSPAPGEPPFVQEGDMVTKGQTVAIVEAMKLMNEIEAEVSGKISKLLVENGTPVAPGTALLVITPS